MNTVDYRQYVGKYVWSDNEENYQSDFFDTREEAAADGFASNDDGYGVWVARVAAFNFNYDHIAESVIEQLQEQAYEEVGEVMESWLVGDDFKKAVAAIAPKIREVIESSHLPNFYRVEDAKYHEPVAQSEQEVKHD